MSEYYVDGYGILRGPNVFWEPLPEAYTQAIIKPTTIILHSQAGPKRTFWLDLWRYMNRSDVVGEAHFLVDLDGTIHQLIPLNRRADCNAKANTFAISFETQDNGAATLATTPWSVEQLDSITNAIAAIGHKYGIPYQTPSHWQDAGVGYHSQYKEWSVYVGKTCPGQARIYQMDYIRQTAAGICACDPPAAGE